MTILGAIFAGGASRRFGTDKALAPIDGQPMLAHVAARLRPQCDALVVVGREWPGLTTAADVPRAGLGPLGALCGALTFARAAGHDLVLSSGCDLPDLPRDLPTLLAPAPCVVQGQPLLGLWRATDAEALAAWLEADGDRAMRSWIARIDARNIPLPNMPSNINTPEEMAAYLAGRRGSA